MASAKLFMGLTLFMLCFNMLVGLYAVSKQGVVSGELPALPADPDWTDYLKLAGGYISTLFTGIFFTISTLPAWLTFLIVAIDSTLGFILVQMIRGN